MSAIKGLENYADRILLRCIDNLSSLFRCSDGNKEERKNAVALVKEKRIKIDRLYRMELSIPQKIKYTPFALFGANIHCRILALLHKKLN